MSAFSANEASLPRTVDYVGTSSVLYSGSIHAGVDELPDLFSTQIAWRKTKRHCEELPNVDKRDLDAFVSDSRDERCSSSRSTRLGATDKEETIKPGSFGLRGCVIDVIGRECLVFDLCRILQLLGQIDVDIKNLSRGRPGLIDRMHSYVKAPAMTSPKDVKAQSGQDCAGLTLIGQACDQGCEPYEYPMQRSVAFEFGCFRNQRLPLHGVVNCVLERCTGVSLTPESAENVDALLKDTSVVATADSVIRRQRRVTRGLVQVGFVGSPKLPSELVSVTVEIYDDLVAERAGVERADQIGSCLHCQPVDGAVSGLREQICEQYVSVGKVSAKHHIGDSTLFGMLGGVAGSLPSSYSRGKNFTCLIVVDVGLTQNRYSLIIDTTGTMPELGGAVKVIAWERPTRSIRMMGVAQ